MPVLVGMAGLNLIASLCLIGLVTGLTEAGNHSSIYFRKAPQSVSVLVGSSVTFECQAAWAAERVRWEVNGRGWDIRDPPMADMRTTPDGNWNSSIHSRRLIADGVYNNSRVQCVLTLQGIRGEKVYSNVALLLVRDFSLVPKSINTTLGSTVSFHCVPYYSEYNALWYINGTELSQSNSSDISLLSETTLKISAHQQLNNTAVYCRLNTTAITSPAALLLVQGELGPVGDLHVTDSSQDFLLISWSPPFSLDITDSDPDIWYSLSLHTSAGYPLPCPGCQNITQTSHNLSVVSLNQGLYEIEIVPANGYGTSSVSQSVNMQLYVRSSAGAVCEDCSTSAQPNTTYSTEAPAQRLTAAGTPTSCTETATLSGLGVAGGILLLAILGVLVMITVCCCYSHHQKGCFCPRRRVWRRETMQRNPAYEVCPPKSISPGQGATVPPPLPLRDLTDNTYSSTISSQEKVYEEIF